MAQQAIHHVDAALYLLGTPLNVVGLGRNVVNDLEAEDTFSGLIQLESGLVITLSATTACRPDDRTASINILGTHGSISIGGVGLNRYSITAEGVSREAHEHFENGYGTGHAKLLKAISRDIGHGTPHPGLDLFLSVSTTSVISAFYHSWESCSWSMVGSSQSSLWGY